MVRQSDPKVINSEQHSVAQLKDWRPLELPGRRSIGAGSPSLTTENIPRQLSKSGAHKSSGLQANPCYTEQQMETSIAQALSPHAKAVGDSVLRSSLPSKQNTDRLSQLMLLVGLRRDEPLQIHQCIHMNEDQ